jgi:O-antigen ligase
MATNPITSAISSISLFAFVGLTIFRIIANQTLIKFSSYTIWYLGFGIMGSISLFYAINNDYVFSDLYILLVCLILTFCFIQYIQNSSGFKRVFSFYAYSPIILVLYLLLSGEINSSGERLGQSTFLNANNLALVMMISLCCIAWLIIYSNRRYLLINVSLALVYLLITALTGGRKFLVLPFVFTLLLLIFRFFQTRKFRLLFYIIFFLLFLITSAWAIMNIPFLYNSIGMRFSGLFDLLRGVSSPSEPDYSTIYRLLMIRSGWNWFLERPILGYGLNNFQVMFSEVLTKSYAHNNYIELLVDTGLVGTIIYYSFYIYLLTKLLRIRNDFTGIKDFFLAYIFVLPLFELGAVTYNLTVIQIFLGLASAYVWIKGERGQYEQDIARNRL